VFPNKSHKNENWRKLNENWRKKNWRKKWKYLEKPKIPIHFELPKRFSKTSKFLKNIFHYKGKFGIISKLTKKWRQMRKSTVICRPNLTAKKRKIYRMWGFWRLRKFGHIIQDFGRFRILYFYIFYLLDSFQEKDTF